MSFDLMLRIARRSSRLALVGLSLLGATASVGAIGACSGDDPGQPPPSSDAGSRDAGPVSDAAARDASPEGAALDGAKGDDASTDAADSSTDDASDAGTDASEGGSNDTGAPDAGFTPATWMSGLPGATSLAGFSIPGTHDTGATIDVPGTTGTTKCQDLSVADQLAIGVRYMDLRLKALTNTSFEVFHTSVDQNLTFDATLDAIYAFFAANPGEAIVMSVKQEQAAAAGVTSSFEQVFGAYVAQHPERWYTAATMPTLDQARGKIVLLRRFGATSLPLGIDASSGWADNTTFTLANGSATLRIQDFYEIPDDASKWNAVTSLFDEAVASSDAGDAGEGPLYLNNTSAYLDADGGLEDILGVSNVINPDLVTYFGAHASGRFGIVAMDYVDANKASLVIRTNFR